MEYCFTYLHEWNEDLVSASGRPDGVWFDLKTQAYRPARHSFDSGSSATTNSEACYTLNTTVIGTVDLEVSYPGFNKASTQLEIEKHDDEVQINVADMVIA